MAGVDKKLTDLTELTTPSNDSFIHVVEPFDISQSPDGSSFKVKKSNFGGLSDAPSDGETYGRKDGAWEIVGGGEVLTTNTNITSSVLSTQDVAGFVAYINGLVSSFAVAVNEIRTYTVTDTGQKFEILLRGRSFGGSEPDILSSDVLEIEGLKERIIFVNRSTWTFPNVGGAPFPLISSTNFELSTANLNFATDNTLTALASLTPLAMAIGYAPFDCRLKRILVDGRSSFASWQGFALRTVVGSNRYANGAGAAIGPFDNQQVDEFNIVAPLSGNVYGIHNSTSSVIIPANHGICLFMSYSRTGISISPILTVQLEFERV